VLSRSAPPARRETTMDALYVLATLLFFALSAAFAHALERL
jgi:hypothetical protein